MGENKYLSFAEVDSLLCDLIREYNRQAHGRESSAVFEALSRVRYLPAADVRPVVRGRWTLHKDGSATCSVCKFVQNSAWDLDNWDNFCPNCGARMEGS